MIWRVILVWLMGMSLVRADLPRSVAIVNAYDTLSRLTNTALVNPWGHVLDGYGYGLDSLGLRTNMARELGLTTNKVSIGYDPIGQLTSWSGVEANLALRHNEQLAYSYDSAGNLQIRTNDALVQTFAVDNLNQLSNVARSGQFTVTGATPVPAASLTRDMPMQWHRGEDIGIHSQGYNDSWGDFFEQNPNASSQQIIDYLVNLESQLGFGNGF